MEEGQGRGKKSQEADDRDQSEEFEATGPLRTYQKEKGDG